MEKNLRNDLRQSAATTSRLSESYIGKIARGGFDRIIQERGIEGFANATLPSGVKLREYRDLHHGIYGLANDLRQAHKKGEVSDTQLQQGIKGIVEYKDQCLGKLNPK
jgi:hypothetical protein